MRYLLLCTCMLMTTATLAQEADTLTAGDDLFNVLEDSTLSVAAPGLLGNDLIATLDSLRIMLIDGPSNGTLEIGADGSFSYTPDAGFTGIDQFTYSLETLPLQILEVDTTRSILNVEMEVSATVLSITLSDSDSTSARLKGTASIYLDPAATPAESLHLYDMALANLDSVDMAFEFGTQLIGGELFAHADADSFLLNLSQRGTPTPVVGDMFAQQDNKVAVKGTVELVGTRLVKDLVPEDPVVFDTETKELEIPGSVVIANDVITITVPLALADTFDISGAEVALDLTGEVVGHGAMRFPTTSNVATVAITVDPQTATSIAGDLPAVFELAQNYPNPFNPVTTIAFSVPASDHVSLKVYDTLGREVAVLVDGLMTAGRHEVRFDAGALPSAMYLYRLEAAGKTAIKKMVVLK